MTKQQLEAAKNSLLASGLQIPAVRHRQFEQLVIDELFDAQSRFNLMADLVPVVSLENTDVIPVLKNGQAKVITLADMLAGIEQEPLTDGSGTTANIFGGVDLGGVLAADAIISGEAFDFGVYLTSGNIVLQTDTGEINQRADNYTWNNLLTELLTLDTTGLKYSADFSAGFVDRSIPDVAWVNEQLANAQPNLVDGSGTTIPVTNDRVDWGGVLSGFTYIDAANNHISFDAVDQFQLNAKFIDFYSESENELFEASMANFSNDDSSTGSFYAHNNSQPFNVGAYIGAQTSNITGVFSEAYLTAVHDPQILNDSLTISLLAGTSSNAATGINIIDRLYNKGASYESDYSVNNAANPRWIPDKGWVESYIGGATTPSPIIHDQTTLLLTNAHHGKFVYITNPAGCTVTVPAGLMPGLRTDFGCDVDGSPIDFVGSGGALLNGEGTTVADPLTGASLIHLGDDDYFLTGALTPSEANSARNKTILIPTPITGDDAGFYTDRELTLEKINDWVRGSSSPSVTWNIVYASTANAVGTNVLSSSRVTTSLTGATTSTFLNAVIPAGSYVRLKVSATSGVVDQLSVSLTYTES